MKNDLNKISGCFSIDYNGRYVVMTGKYLAIFNADGDMIAKRTDLRNVFKILFTSSNSVLIDCGPQKAYIMLSLEDGSELWRISQPKFDYSSSHFASSSDGKYVYDYFDLKGQQYFVKINMHERTLDYFMLNVGLECTSDIICDADDIPCLLEHHYEAIAGKRISLNGVRYQYQDDFVLGGARDWKYKWELTAPTISCFFLGSTEHILTRDLKVYEPASQQLTDLIRENHEDFVFAPPPSECRIDPSGRYVILQYNTFNLVVDWPSGKVVARYCAPYKMGCIIGDTYWISTGTRVERRPFPFMEDIPAERYDFWKP